MTIQGSPRFEVDSAKERRRQYPADALYALIFAVCVIAALLLLSA